MNKVEKANQYIDLVRLKSGEALLFCSLGKDSLVLLDLIYPKFDRIVCVFMYFVPDLEHINRLINWVKSRYPRVEFVQVIHNGGVRIYAVSKYPGSVVAGIDKMKEYETFIAKRSYNLQREYRKYVWVKDKDGNYINEPEDHDNHGIDAARYYVLGELLGKIIKPKDLTGIFTH